MTVALGFVLRDFASFLSCGRFASVLIMAALYGIGQAIIFLPCGFFLLLSVFFSSPNLSGRKLDVYHTLAHDVALVRI